MTVVVVGDALLDVDVSGTSTRLSPDAPVPVVDVTTRSTRAGGAGLVAAMLVLDGEPVVLVTALGDDAGAAELRAAIHGVDVVAGPLHAGTPTKTRLRIGDHAVARVDESCGPAPAPGVTEDMLDAVRRADAVVVADYGRGLTADDRLRAVLTEVAARVPVVWDPHPKGSAPVAGCAVVTPNQGEASGLHGSAVSGVDDAWEAGHALRETWAVEAVAVTLGGSGAVLALAGAATGEDPLHLPAPVVEVLDPCGAGDRLASALAVALARGASAPDAVAEAVERAARFLADGGVASLPLDRLRATDDAEALDDAAPAVGTDTRADAGAAGSAPTGTEPDADELPEPIRLPGSDALDVARRTREAGGTVVATGGCFDLLHAGHARTLAAARALGDCLVVCLNSDDSVTRLKGPERPIMAQEDRVDLLLALECVDAVIVFDEDTPHDVLSRVRPDVWVKGGDYSADTLPEAGLVAGWGGRTLTVPYHPGRSTTRLASALERVG
ncbi:PfkB family carbohydrate kinase [Frigoribacterium salinisoli]